MPVLDLVSLSLGCQIHAAPCSLPSKDILLPFVEDHFIDKLQANIDEYSLPSWQKQVIDRKKEEKRTVRTGTHWVDRVSLFLD